MGRGSVDRLEDDPGLQPRSSPRDLQRRSVAAGISVLNPCSDTKNPSAPSGKLRGGGVEIARFQGNLGSG